MENATGTTATSVISTHSGQSPRGSSNMSCATLIRHAAKKAAPASSTGAATRRMGALARRYLRSRRTAVMPVSTTAAARWVCTTTSATPSARWIRKRLSGPPLSICSSVSASASQSSCQALTMKTPIRNSVRSKRVSRCPVGNASRR